MKKGTIEKHGSIAKLKQEKNGYSIKLKLQVPMDSPSTQKQEGTDEVDGESCDDITTVDGLKSYLQKMNYEVKDSHLVSVGVSGGIYVSKPFICRVCFTFTKRTGRSDCRNFSRNSKS